MRTPPGVDVDLHLLHEPQLDGQLMRGCIARAHESLAVSNLAPGEYYVVVDTWTNGDGRHLSGLYDLAFEVVEEDEWRVVEIEDNVLWRRWRGSIDGIRQTINQIRIHPSALHRLVLSAHRGCETVGQHGHSLGAVVGINGGYFGAGCGPQGLVRTNGQVLSVTAPTRPALPQQAMVGWNGDRMAFEWGQTGVDWPAYAFALSAHPMLVEDGQSRAEVQPGEQVYSAVDWGVNPRSVIGIDENEYISLITFDGRTASGEGLSTPALATWLRNELNLVQALNLDGGGSTTLMVRQCWLNDIVSHPSDNGVADHLGSRAVSNGIYLR